MSLIAAPRLLSNPNFCIGSGVYVFQSPLACAYAVFVNELPRCALYNVAVLLMLCVRLGSLLWCCCTAFPGDRLAIRFHFGILTISSPKDTHSVAKPPCFPNYYIYPSSPLLLFTVISCSAVFIQLPREMPNTHVQTHTHTQAWKGLETKTINVNVEKSSFTQWGKNISHSERRGLERGMLLQKTIRLSAVGQTWRLIWPYRCETTCSYILRYLFPVAFLFIL